MTTLYIKNCTFVLNKSQSCVWIGISWVLHLFIGLATSCNYLNYLEFLFLIFAGGLGVSPVGVKNVTCSRCVWRTLSWRCHAGDFPVSTLGCLRKVPNIHSRQNRQEKFTDYPMISMFNMFKWTFVNNESLVGSSQFWLMVNFLLC